MDHDDVAADWPYLVRAGCFDVRGPMFVAIGYARMLDSDRLGPLSEKQHAALVELQKALRQIRERVERLENLSLLESRGLGSGTATFSLREMLSDIVAGRPFLHEPGRVDLQADGPDEVIGHLRLLRDAVDGLVWSVFAQLIDRPLSIRIIDRPEASERWIVLAASDQIQESIECRLEELAPRAECTDPRTLDLPFAGRVVRAHGGKILGLPSGIVGAVVALPRPPNEAHSDGAAGSSRQG